MEIQIEDRRAVQKRGGATWSRSTIKLLVLQTSVFRIDNNTLKLYNKKYLAAMSSSITISFVIKMTGRE